MIEEIDGCLTEFLDIRYSLEYKVISPLVLRYNVKNADHDWVKNPLKSESLKARLEKIGVRLIFIRHNKDDETGNVSNTEFHFAQLA